MLSAFISFSTLEEILFPLSTMYTLSTPSLLSSALVELSMLLLFTKSIGAFFSLANGFAQRALWIELPLTIMAVFDWTHPNLLTSTAVSYLVLPINLSCFVVLSAKIDEELRKKHNTRY